MSSRDEITTEKWNNCNIGSELIYSAFKLGVDIRLLYLALGKCIEPALRFLKDQRSINAIKAAIDFGNGVIDEKQLFAFRKDAVTAGDENFKAYFNKCEKYTKTEYENCAICAASNVTNVNDFSGVAIKFTAWAIYYSTCISPGKCLDFANCIAYSIDPYQNSDIKSFNKKVIINHELASAKICKEILSNAVFERIDLIPKEKLGKRIKYLIKQEKIIHKEISHLVKLTKCFQCKNMSHDPKHLVEPYCTEKNRELKYILFETMKKCVFFKQKT